MISSAPLVGPCCCRMLQYAPRESTVVGVESSGVLFDLKVKI